MWDLKSRKVLKSRDVSFLDEFPAGEDTGEIINDILLQMCAKEQNQTNTDPVQELDAISDGEDSTDDFHSIDSAEEEQPSSSDSDILGCAPVPGRPTFIADGRPGRPKKVLRRVAVKASKEQSDNIEPDEAATEDEEESENVTTENESDEVIASSTGEESNDEEFAGLTNFDPKSAKVALAAPEADEWRVAMRVVDRPKDRKVIGCRWVLRTKLIVDGLIERRKARLVAKGFAQCRYTDFNETFAPVARAESIRLVMARKKKRT
ncbi:retrotransposon ty1-copia subclass [Lasius niger]|uniref:Retrotransposon ty1-copia subclass n=1 Tax=Lasius niger TaxID=67767 RepID=A0A0J7K237_LASNI|nr:retrotransposon ty1-copia subclass [Lasius niger]